MVGMVVGDGATSSGAIVTRLTFDSRLTTYDYFAPRLGRAVERVDDAQDGQTLVDGRGRWRAGADAIDEDGDFVVKAAPAHFG